MKNFQQNILIVFALCLIPACLIYPILWRADWYLSDETIRYPMLFEAFANSFKHGNWYPRWLPELNGGYGYPTFVFYQPGIFYFALPFFLCISSTITATHAALFAMFFVCAIGAYKLARRTNDYVSSLLLVFLYFFSTYTWIDLYERGDLSELFATLQCTWVIYFLLELKDRIQAKQPCLWVSAGFAFSLFCIIITHPFVGLFLITFLVFFCANLATQSLYPKVFCSWVISSITAAIVTSSAYWLPVIELKSQGNFQHVFEGWYATTNNLLPLSEVFKYIQPHCFLVLIGFLLMRTSPLHRMLLVLYMLGIFLTSTASRFIWENLKILDFVQFPWRIYSVLCIIQYMLIIPIGRLKEQLPPAKYHAVLAVIALLFIFTAHSYFPTPIAANYEQLKGSTLASAPFKTFSQLNEFDYKDFSREELTPRTATAPMVAWTSPDNKDNQFKVLSSNNEPYSIDYDVSVTSIKHPILILNQMFFPGWKIVVNGEDIIATQPNDIQSKAIWSLSKNGLMQITFLEPGNYHLQAWYDGPPDWEKRVILILLFLLVLGGLALVFRKTASKS